MPDNVSETNPEPTQIPYNFSRHVAPDVYQSEKPKDPEFEPIPSENEPSSNNAQVDDNSQSQINPDAQPSDSPQVDTSQAEKSSVTPVEDLPKEKPLTPAQKNKIVEIVRAIFAYSIVLGYVLIVLGIGFYLLPSILAFMLDANNKAAICIVNVCFGWIGIGWVVALLMVFWQKHPQPVVYVAQGPAEGEAVFDKSIFRR